MLYHQEKGFSMGWFVELDTGERNLMLNFLIIFTVSRQPDKKTLSRLN